MIEDIPRRLIEYILPLCWIGVVFSIFLALSAGVSMGVEFFLTDAFSILPIITATLIIILCCSKKLVEIKEDFFFHLKERIPGPKFTKTLENYRNSPINKWEKTIPVLVGMGRSVEYFLNPKNRVFVESGVYGTHYVGGEVILWVDAPLGCVLSIINVVMWIICLYMVLLFTFQLVFVLRLPIDLESHLKKQAGDGGGKEGTIAQVFKLVIKPRWRCQIRKIVRSLAALCLALVLKGVYTAIAFRQIEYALISIIIGGSVLLVVVRSWMSFSKTTQSTSQIPWTLSSLNFAFVFDHNSKDVNFSLYFSAAGKTWRILETWLNQAPLKDLIISLCEKYEDRPLVRKTFSVNSSTNYLYLFSNISTTIGLITSDPIEARNISTLSEKFKRFETFWKESKHDSTIIREYFVKNLSHCLSEKWELRDAGGDPREAIGEGTTKGGPE
ncbi:MAG: hypothetical protein ACTSU5_10705 [Promethearchaeota archaeon]